MFNHGLGGWLGGWLSARAPRNGEALVSPSRGLTSRVLHNDGTYRCDRNAEKHRVKADVKRCRLVLVNHHASMMTLGRASKRDNDSMKRVEMLSDRRLRQRNGDL